MALYLGLDIGGTFVKGVIIDKYGKVYAEGNVLTDLSDVAGSGAELAEKLVRGAGVVFSEIKCAGVCCPGMIDDKGNVIFAGNLNLKNYPLKKLISEKLNMPVRVCNDANAAALGEAKFGAGKDTKDSVLITLGTGVGGGIIIGGKLFEGYKSAGAEIGHMVIECGGDLCTCGRRGCFEAYCSATALTAATKAAMEDDTASAMWKSYSLENADGRAAFEYMDCDRSARRVVEKYISYLACGITNICNIFRPQVIIIGGGVAAQGSRLITPLQQAVDKEIFGGVGFAPVKIVCAELGPKAGAFGAAALGMEGSR